jgi:tetratricopeptide (TPR) repeat protein
VLTLLIALLAGGLFGGLFRVAHLVHTTAGAIFPGVAATLVTAIFLFRRIGQRINPLVEEAQRHLQGGRREMALQSLRSGLKLGAWHPLLEGQLRAQIGALLYDSGDLDGALPELERASKRPWESRAFLACAHFKKRAGDPMKRAFEDAVKVGDKDGLSWTLYAWCMNARGDKDAALAVLKRGIEKLPTDQRLKNNLELVQEGKKLKVAPYGDRWARFQLDGSVPGVPKAARGFAQRPGFRQRPQKRKA